MEQSGYHEFAELIANETDSFIYVSDVENYELIFLNESLKRFLGVLEDCRGKKCYKILQNREEPCPFCTNERLEQGKFYRWNHYNEHLQIYYELKDKLIEVGGKKYRLEICNDITQIEGQKKELALQLSTEETLVACIQTLAENMETNTAIDSLLEIIGEFYKAERSYIFEIDYDRQRVFNSYEWCKEGVEPQLENLQNLPLTAIERWLELFHTKEVVTIDSLSDAVQKDTMEYFILSSQGIDRLMATPIWENGEIMGFIGVDNPSCGEGQIKLLKSITYFIKNDLEKRGLTERLKELSYKDALTGLGNRNQYIDEIEKLQEQSLESLGILFIDINGLKKANDRYGHQYGDRMIQNVASGVKRCFPENAYRIGGDEFVAFFINGKEEEFGERLEQLRIFEKEECICDFSLGVTFNDEDVDVRKQIGYSDDMMYVQKKVYYGHAAEGKNSYHEALARELVDEIGRGIFEVYLQPKVALDTEELVGAEALVRKKTEHGTVLLPAQFLPLYEAEGIIQYLDMFVFEQVCRMLCEWKERGFRLIPVSVNISRVSLMGPDIVAQMVKIRNRYQVEAKCVKLEVIGNINKIAPTILMRMMDEFKKQDFTLSLDDYGADTPYNTLLSKMDFDELKIDRSLVGEIVENHRARIVLEHSLNLSRDLGGMETVAEGIENVEQLDILKGYGGMIGQGFVFAKPMPMEEFVNKYAEKYLS